MTDISRREALKRGAVFGGALVWATPVIQTVGMTPAFAQNTSPVDECEDFVFWRAKANWDEDEGAFIWEPDPGVGANDCDPCDDADGVDGSSFLDVENVVLNDDGEPDTAEVVVTGGDCEILGIFTKEANDCHTGVIAGGGQSATVGNPGSPAISHIEVCIKCCIV